MTVRSDPITCTTTADSNGNWSCTLPSDLPPGDHTVTVRVVNPDNSIDELGPYAVTVANSSTTVVSPATPLAPNTGEGRMLGVQNSYIIATVLITSTGLFIILIYNLSIQRYGRYRRTRVGLNL
ncbi:MAG: hypothetical protein EOO68_20285 [Moraxellaceae bacterium]|nr:MAG: hypothetical protein EOO68_20285 [Moraxellaceae bacterium]